jgi:hypothetical protein
MFSMNFFQFNLDFRRRRFKTFFLFVLLLIIFLFFYTYSHSQEKSSEEIILSEGILTDEHFFGEYTYRHYTGPPFREHVFQIYKGKKLVYQSKVGYAYWLSKENELFSPGNDITGDGIPDLVVMEDSGGSFFSRSCMVFSLGKQFRLIQSLPGGDFKDLNQDGKLDYITYEIGFSSWHASHADSPAPQLVYEYYDHEYLLAPALMYKPIPSEEEIIQAISRVSQDIITCEKEKWLYPAHCWYDEGTYLPPSAWSYMLDLMFSGHPDEAYDFLEQVWPEGKLGKSNFIYDFEKRLNRYTFWPALSPMFSQIAKIKKEDPAVSLEEEMTQGVLYIWASPENAKVYANNEYLGEVPLSTDLLAPGEYHLRLSQPGYYDIDITAEVVPLHIQEVEDRLEQKVGNSTYFLSSTPEKAEGFHFILSGFILTNSNTFLIY